MRLWYLSHRRPAKAQASLRIRAVSPEPSMFAHMNYGRRRRVRSNIRHLAPTGWLRMRVWRMRVRRTKRVIISWHGSFHRWFVWTSTKSAWPDSHERKKKNDLQFPNWISIESTVKFEKSGFSIKSNAYCLSCTFVVLDFLLTPRKISNTCLTYRLKRLSLILTNRKATVTNQKMNEYLKFLLWLQFEQYKLRFSSRASNFDRHSYTESLYLHDLESDRGQPVDYLLKRLFGP